MAKRVYTILLTRKAEKDLTHFHPKTRDKVTSALLRLKTNPSSQQSKPLIKHRSAQYRLRLGDYRILYDIYQEKYEVLILRIGHRKDIYR